MFFSFIALIPVGWWYGYWVPYLVDTYGFWHFYMGKGLTDGLMEIYHHSNDVLKRFYDTAMKYIGFFTYAAGVILAMWHRQRLIIYLLLVAGGAFFLVMTKAGFAFPHHSYYVIPFVPIMCIFAGYFIDWVAESKRWVAIFLLAGIAVEGIANQWHDFTIKPEAKALVSLELVLDKYTDSSDLILINSGDNPTPMYFAHRKGWVASNEQLMEAEFVDDLVDKGLKQIVVLKKVFGSDINLPDPILFDGDDFKIYSLDVRKNRMQ